jgi:xanthine dehydrogenase accessory factor
LLSCCPLKFSGFGDDFPHFNFVITTFTINRKFAVNFFVQMKELAVILEKYKELVKTNQSAVLATVVDVVGSGYRRPGARMLIDKNGYGIGTVSGGCLEADVLERAKKVLQSGEPTVITYDTTKDENSLFGLGMGCRGIVRILLEPIERESYLVRVLQIASEHRERQFIATLISSDNNSFISGRIFYDEAEQFYFKNLPNVLEDSRDFINDCFEFFSQNKSAEVREYQNEKGRFELLFENIDPPLNLLLFGAGFDALPLVRFAKELGWRVTAIDHRAAFANRERLPEADEIIVSHSEDLSDEIFQDENSVAVVMTHNYDRDREILRRLLLSNCRYVGALGPKKRTEKILAEIGAGFSDEQLAKLHAPIGLDIGADTPEAIALSIVAEIQSVLSNRDGGFLRNRKGSIYERNE